MPVTYRAACWFVALVVLLVLIAVVWNGGTCTGEGAMLR